MSLMFSCSQFYVPGEVGRFRVSLQGCQVDTRTSPALLARNICVEYAALRARALPKHNPDSEAGHSVSVNGSVEWEELRPYRDRKHAVTLILH